MPHTKPAATEVAKDLGVGCNKTAVRYRRHSSNSGVETTDIARHRRCQHDVYRLGAADRDKGRHEPCTPPDIPIRVIVDSQRVAPPATEEGDEAREQQARAA